MHTSCPNSVSMPRMVVRGFTLIELMIVISIIGIMASLALPTYSNWVNQEKIRNAVKLTSSLKEDVNKYYQKNAVFPKNNVTAGIPEPGKLLSPEVSSIDLENGAFHIQLSEFHKDLKDKVISVRPLYVAGFPKSPISWICGNAKIPKGMKASGTNKTNVPYTFLPIECRDLTGETAKKQIQQDKITQEKHKTNPENKNNSTNSDEVAISNTINKASDKNTPENMEVKK